VNYYFMPRVEGFETAVTLANFPPVGSEMPGTQVAHFAWTDGRAWHLQALDSVLPGTVKTYSSTGLPPGVPPSETCFFFLYPSELRGSHDKLPLDPVMETAPAWRGNIQIRSVTTSTSYQGEYPGAMLKLKNASLVSLSPMLQKGDGVRMYFLLANMLETPEKRQGVVRFAGFRDRKILLEGSLMTNSVSVVDLTGLQSVTGESLCGISPSMTGVPIYFSHDRDKRQLSLEHTHPPDDLMVFSDNPRAVVKNMKNWWLDALRP
jgi:hypothetical protein